MYLCQIEYPDRDGSFFSHRGLGETEDAAFEDAVRRSVVAEHDNWLNNYCTTEEVDAVIALATRAITTSSAGSGASSPSTTDRRPVRGARCPHRDRSAAPALVHPPPCAHC